MHLTCWISAQAHSRGGTGGPQHWRAVSHGGGGCLLGTFTNKSICAEDRKQSCRVLKDPAINGTSVVREVW